MDDVLFWQWPHGLGQFHIKLFFWPKRSALPNSPIYNSHGISEIVGFSLPDTWLHELVEQFFVLLQELYTGGNDRQILVWSPSKWNADELVHPLNFQPLYTIISTSVPISLVLSSKDYLIFQDEWSKMGKASALDEDNWSDWSLLLALRVLDFQVIYEFPHFICT